MQPIVLRPNQITVKQGIKDNWDGGFRNVMAVCPTGFGKSIVMADIVYDWYVYGRRVAVIAHRNELVSQMSMHLARRGIKHKLIASDTTIKQITRKHRNKFSGKCFIDPSAPVAVVGVDTLMARTDELTSWAEQVELWIIDEAHHTVGDPNEPANCDPNKWGKAVKMFKNAIGLGVTATPQRADGKGLGAHHDGVFEAMVLGPPMRELIQHGDLAEYEIVCPASDLDVSGENLSANGDWSSQTLKKAAKKSHIVGDVVANYIKYANGRQAIVFATDVETSGDIAKSFNESGIRAMSLSAKTHTDIREKAMSDFEAGILNVLVNVDLFDEGVDCGSLDVVIMARPTNSLAKYLQQVGRALRPRAGKVALIIDHVSNVVLHGLPDKVHKWTLDRRDKRAEGLKDPDDIPLRACTGCSKVYEKFRTACPHCGTEVPLPTPRERTVEMVEGDLILLDRAMLEQMRKAAEPESPESMQSRVGFVAGDIAGKAAFNRQFDKIVAHTRLKEVIAQWAAIERERGFTDSEIQRKFFHTVGVDVLTALDGSQKQGEMEAMAERIEGWYKR